MRKRMERAVSKPKRRSACTSNLKSSCITEMRARMDLVCEFFDFPSKSSIVGSKKAPWWGHNATNNHASAYPAQPSHQPAAILRETPEWHMMRSSVAFLVLVV